MPTSWRVDSNCQIMFVASVVQGALKLGLKCYSTHESMSDCKLRSRCGLGAFEVPGVAVGASSAFGGLGHPIKEAQSLEIRMMHAPVVRSASLCRCPPEFEVNDNLQRKKQGKRVRERERARAGGRERERERD